MSASFESLRRAQRARAVSNAVPAIDPLATVIAENAELRAKLAETEALLAQATAPTAGGKPRR